LQTGRDETRRESERARETGVSEPWVKRSLGAVDDGRNLFIDDGCGLLLLLRDEVLDRAQQGRELALCVGEDVGRLGAEGDVCENKRRAKLGRAGDVNRKERDKPGLEISSPMCFVASVMPSMRG
jgi:hypothetical protein